MLPSRRRVLAAAAAAVSHETKAKNKPHKTARVIIAWADGNLYKTSKRESHDESLM